MKSVVELLKMDHKHLEHELCHPRRQASFDHSAIERKIDQIREKKEKLKQEAAENERKMEAKISLYEENPLMELYDNSLEPLNEHTSLLLRQKMGFIEEKVYIGAKNNVNQEYISRVNDASEAPGPLKDELNLFMEDIMANMESEILQGTYEVFNKKDPNASKATPTDEKSPPPSTKMIQIKKVELAGKIDELKQELTLTEQQHSQLSNSNASELISRNKSYSARQVPSSLSGSVLHSSVNVEDFSLHSEKTKQAEEMIKRFQREQEEKRRRRLKREEQVRALEVQSMREKEEFEHRIKEERHQKLKVKFEQERQQKQSQRAKSLKAKEDYERFLKEYKKKVPLFKEKDTKFRRKMEKAEKERCSAVFSEIKEAKRSIDISEIREHEKKYQGLRKEFESEKLANLKHRQKEIFLRHKQDKLYFRGRYHSMLKEEEERVPEDPTVKRDELLKRKRQFAEKVKKEHIPHADVSKQKELEELIVKINRNKPTATTQSPSEVGNKYFRELHDLIAEIKKQGKVKVELPEEIKPRYRDYLHDIRRQREHSTISYTARSEQWLEQEALKSDRNIRMKEQVIRAKLQGEGANDLQGQLKEINGLDLELLKAVRLKADLLKKVDPTESDQSED